MKIKDVSRLTGISCDSVSQIERGLVNPRLSSVLKIIEALDCKLEIIY